MLGEMSRLSIVDPKRGEKRRRREKRDVVSMSWAPREIRRLPGQTRPWLARCMTLIRDGRHMQGLH